MQSPLLTISVATVNGLTDTTFSTTQLLTITTMRSPIRLGCLMINFPQTGPLSVTLINIQMSSIRTRLKNTSTAPTWWNRFRLNSVQVGRSYIPKKEIYPELRVLKTTWTLVSFHKMTLRVLLGSLFTYRKYNKSSYFYFARGVAHCLAFNLLIPTHCITLTFSLS